MFRRNPDILALTFLVLVIGVVSLAADASSFLLRNLNAERHEHLSRKVELIGERVEAKAKAIEQNAKRIADRFEQEAKRHAERAERLSKVWE